MTNKEAKEILEWELNSFKYTDNEFVEATKVAIKALEERPKGKWIIKRANGCNYFICSECKILFNDWDNYCPNCGADMRSVDEGLHERAVSDLSKTVDDLYKKLRGDV